MKTIMCFALMCVFCVTACAPTYGYGYNRSVRYEQDHNNERTDRPSK